MSWGGEERYSSTLSLTLALNRGEWFNATPRLLSPGKEPVYIVWEAGWAPGTVWTNGENLAHTHIRFPKRPTRSESQYLLNYRGPILCTSLDSYTSSDHNLRTWDLCYKHWVYRIGARMTQKNKHWVYRIGAKMTQKRALWEGSCWNSVLTQGACGVNNTETKAETWAQNMYTIFLSGIYNPYEFEPPHSRGSENKHKDAPQSVRLLWTSDQPVAETSTGQHTQHS
jgi:hypothetical protein